MTLWPKTMALQELARAVRSLEGRIPPNVEYMGPNAPMAESISEACKVGDTAHAAVPTQSNTAQPEVPKIIILPIESNIWD